MERRMVFKDFGIVTQSIMFDNEVPHGWGTPMKFLRRLFYGVLSLAEDAWIRLGWIFFPVESEPFFPKNILVMGYMGAGDLLMLTPALQTLKAAFPQAKISLLTGPY